MKNILFKKIYNILLKNNFTNSIINKPHLVKKENIIIANNPIILASTSSARKLIMENCLIPFTAIAPEFNEEAEKENLNSLPIGEIATELAIGKAKSLSNKFANSIIIGSDQICECEGKIINKSNNLLEATEQLKILRGKTHLQHNAIAIVKAGEVIFKNYSCSSLTMKNISDAEILHYLAFDQSWGCAGSYKYESLGKHLFSKVEGNYFAIVGMDIQPIISFLHHHNFIKFI